MKRKQYYCGKCNRFIKFEKHKATQKELKENNTPEEYDIPICTKCGVLSGYEVEYK